MTDLDCTVVDFEVNFQALPSRFSNTICIRRGSAFAFNPLYRRLHLPTLGPCEIARDLGRNGREIDRAADERIARNPRQRQQIVDELRHADRRC